MSEELPEVAPLDEIGKLSFPQAVLRGITLRCPACGRGRLFRGLFSMNRECATCRYPFERPPGYFLGSTYINYGVTAVITTFTYVVLYFGVGVEKQTLLPCLLVFCLIFPLVFFRFARSLWLSLDCFFDRLGAQQAIAKSQQLESRREVSNNGA